MPGQPKPYDVAADPAALVAQADAGHRASPPAFCAFDTTALGSTAQLQGEMTDDIAVNLAAGEAPGWTWDTRKAVWVRTENARPTLTAEGSPVQAANVLLLQVDLKAVTASGKFTGEGRGLVASGQLSTPITWKKAGDADPWQFVDATGAPVVLIPGTTWVELIPPTGGWSVS